MAVAAAAVQSLDTIIQRMDYPATILTLNTVAATKMLSVPQTHFEQAPTPIHSEQAPNKPVAVAAAGLEAQTHSTQATNMARPYYHGSKKNKCVTFNDKVKIRTMYVWPYAHKEARKSNFKHIVADRHRFQRRIEKMEQLLSPILFNTYKKMTRKTIHIDFMTTLFSKATIS